MKRKTNKEERKVERDMASQVYDSLLGNLIPEYALGWVENIFVPGNPCHDEYSCMLEAYQRICRRLGSGEEDADLEIIVNSLLSHGEILAKEMFRYGMVYGRKDTVDEGDCHGPAGLAMTEKGHPFRGVLPYLAM